MSLSLSLFFSLCFAGVKAEEGKELLIIRRERAD